MKGGGGGGSHEERDRPASVSTRHGHVLILSVFGRLIKSLPFRPKLASTFTTTLASRASPKAPGDENQRT